jgi:predicted outer membrane repeat protein
MANRTYRIAKMVISLFSLILFVYATAEAKTIYVDDDGPADFDNIQAAIDDSNDGDTIIVNPGTYTGDGNRDISYNGKAITFRSEDPNDPNIVAATIIDCNGTEEEPHRGFLFNSGEEANSVLAGLTITNGYAKYGGGIYCEASRPTITNCTLVANSARLSRYDGSGGGISCRFCSMKGPSLPGMATDPIPSDGAINVSTTVNLMWSPGLFAESHDVYFGTSSPPPFVCNQTSTTFDPGTLTTGTTYYWRVDEINKLGKTVGTLWTFTTGGPPTPPQPPPPSTQPPPPQPAGAIEEQSSPQVLSETNLPGPAIKNCIIIGNFANEGGGMYTQNSRPILSDCTFSDNDADEGGGMFTERSNPALLNCAFIGNSSFLGGGLLCEDGNTMLTNCSFSENSSHYGGGVFNSYDSNTTLTDCIFNDNSVYFSGGGIYNDESCRSNLTNCTFKGNSTYFQHMFFEGGGGIYNLHATSNLIDCTFIGNTSYRGGGMLNLSHTDMSLTGCVFIENSADGYGGGLYSANPNTILTDCIFSNNSAGGSGDLFDSAGNGGGMYNLADSASLNRCMFNGNSALLGGGIYNGMYSTTTLTNCLFSGNSAESQYSGPLIIYPPVYGYGGGIYDGYGGTKVINCSFNENRATGEGGAIWLKYPLPPPVPPFPFPAGVTSSDTITEIPPIMDVNDSNGSLISNCIVWGNEDSDGSGELSQIRIDPNEIPVVINYSCIQGWSGNLEGTGNIDADPCFVQLGFWYVLWYRVPEYVWYEGHFQLLPESLCINAGDPNYIDEPNDTDLDGRSRVVDGRIDMGAYEYQGPGGEKLFYVDDDAAGANNGSSWDDAFNFLQDALTVARYGDAILVAQGMYKPDRADHTPITPGDRLEFFWLRNGVSIIGGYAGAGAPDPYARNIELYETILSGDLDGNDVQVHDPCDLKDEPSRFGNSLRVLLTYGANVSTVLDGFTIYGGYYSGMINAYGGPTICNCTFIGNGGDLMASGMYNYESSPAVNNCEFIENNCGMYNRRQYSVNHCSPIVSNCIFSGNSDDGGMYNSGSNPILKNCIFTHNFSGDVGGGMQNFRSNPLLINCLFSGNKASENGGALYSGQSTTTLNNCTLSDNWAGSYGGGICNEGSDAQLINCILWGDSAEEGSEIYLVKYIDYKGKVYLSTMDVNYSDIMGGYTNIYVDTGCTLNWGPGNIDADPCFVKPGYWDVSGVWIEGDYNLLPSSPCIDTGKPNYVPVPGETDLNGNSRILDGDNDGVPVVDMGAYEYFSPRPVAEAGPDQLVECACNTEEGTKVTLDGTSSYDEGSNPLTFTWTGPFVESPANGATPTVTLEDGCPGEYVITLVVNNGIEDSEPNDVMITVVDTTPPEFSLTVSPAVLWPPNHKMVEITPSWAVSDECDASPDVSLVSIVANEGDDTIGDGHTSDDIQIGEDGSIYLRAERSGAGSERVYTITCQAVDDSGNTTVRSSTVSIPHDFKVLAGIASRWLWIKPAGRIPEDLNGDGVVNFTDFARFAENWIK